jgi:hypothetical protein
MANGGRAQAPLPPGSRRRMVNLRFHVSISRAKQIPCKWPNAHKLDDTAQAPTRCRRKTIRLENSDMLPCIETISVVGRMRQDGLENTLRRLRMQSAKNLKQPER